MLDVKLLHVVAKVDAGARVSVSNHHSIFTVALLGEVRGGPSKLRIQCIFARVVWHVVERDESVFVGARDLVEE